MLCWREPIVSWCWLDGKPRWQFVMRLRADTWIHGVAAPTLDLVWSYARRFCCEQLCRDQKSGFFQLESSGLRDPQRIDRLLLVVAIAVLVSSPQGYAVILDGLRHRVDPHWQRGMSFVRIGLQ